VTNVTVGCPHTNLLSLVWNGDNEEDMEILLTPSPPASLPRPGSRRLVRVARTPRVRAADDLIRVASAGAVTFSIAVPLVIVVLFATTPSVTHYFPEAAAATALYLPLYVHHVRCGLRGERPRFLPLTLGAMAVVIVGVTPLIGAEWFYAYSALVASVLVATPPRFSFPAVACTLTAVGIWTAELRNDSGIPIYGGGLAAYFPIAIAERAAAVFILVWLVVALRRVQSARMALAEAALETERGRIDIELSESVVSELEEVIMKGVHAEDAAGRGSPKAEEELESLVKGSRLALANARRIIRQYKIVSPTAELEKAAMLLRSAGIVVTIVLPDTGLPLTLDESLRSALQVAVAQLLSEEVAGPVVLKLGCASGRFQLETVLQSNDEPAA
jgi:two-component system sensor histidine kinase DesK